MLKLKQYRGYIGLAKKEKDGIYHGKLVGISDLVTFESDSIKTLQLSFEDAVDDYCLTREKLDNS